MKALLSQSLFCLLIRFCLQVSSDEQMMNRRGNTAAGSWAQTTTSLPSVSPPPTWSAVVLWEQDSSWDARLSLLRWCVNRAGADRWASANWSRWPFHPTVHHSPRLYKKMQWNSKEIIILYVPWFATHCGRWIYRIHQETQSTFPGSLHWSSRNTVFC